jgi:hypothetical protein
MTFSQTSTVLSRPGFTACGALIYNTSKSNKAIAVLGSGLGKTSPNAATSALICIS